MSQSNEAVATAPVPSRDVLTGLLRDGARQLKLPILIIQFGRDYQVTKMCFDARQAGLKDRKNVTFKVYDDLNHLMIKGSGKSSPQEYSTAGNVDEAVVKDLAAWIATPGQEKSE